MIISEKNKIKQCFLLRSLYAKVIIRYGIFK